MEFGCIYKHFIFFANGICKHANTRVLLKKSVRTQGWKWQTEFHRWIVESYIHSTELSI